MIVNKGQIIVGAPGSGKTTYCLSMAYFLFSEHKNPVIINLDPGNDSKTLFYKIDICKLVFSDEISSELHLGPNGSIFYSLEYFERNSDWFEKKIKRILKLPFELYFLFDLPGQIELYTHHRVVRNLVKRITEKKIQLATVILNDSVFWKDRTVICSVLITCISIMLNIELPYINLLTKIDLYFFKNNKNSLNSKKFKIFTFENLFLQNSIFFWANKFYKNLNDIIFDFSSLSTIPINNFDKNDIKKIFKNLNTILFGTKTEVK